MRVLVELIFELLGISSVRKRKTTLKTEASSGNLHILQLIDKWIFLVKKALTCGRNFIIFYIPVMKYISIS